MPGPDTDSAASAFAGEGQPVRVVDKRAENRREAELKRLQKEVNEAERAAAARAKALDEAHADIAETSDGRVIVCRFCTAEDGKHDLSVPHEANANIAIVDEPSSPPPVAEGEQTARQLRIEVLRSIGRGNQLTAEEGAELLRLQAAEDQGLDEDSSVVRAATAFLVIVGFDGTAQATSDVNLLMDLERAATVDDMDAGCAIVRRDIQASMTAKQVVFGLQVSAQAMAEKQAAVQAMNKVQAAGGVNLGGRRRR